MITDKIYIESFRDDQYHFGYKLLIESGEDTRTSLSSCLFWQL